MKALPVVHKLSRLTAALNGPAAFPAGSPAVSVRGPVDRDIAALRYDSRKITRNDVFFAWKGKNEDGHRFIASARDQGAAAIVLEDASYISQGTQTYIQVPDARRALALMAAAYYGRPDKQLTMTAVTGTNGKTTTTLLIKHLLASYGRETGSIGTVGYEIGDRILPASRTTPEGSDLHELLALMKSFGCSDVVMEVSSHALDQGRTLPIDFKVGVFTNLTPDHLDYHETMENYFQAKKKLFAGAPGATSGLDRPGNAGVAVTNLDDARGAEIAGGLSPAVRVIGYSIEGNPDAILSATDLRYDVNGMHGTVRFGDDSFPFHSPLIGSYNASNVLAAMGAGWALGLDPRFLVQTIATAPGVPGRMERFMSADGVTAVVDYAHTEDAVRKVLSVLRPITTGRLFCIIGCGGNRDITKRARMAQAAVEGADRAIFTADNPRRESLEKILDDMEAGVPGATNYLRLADRREAIAEAVAHARRGDVICVAGKGHETTQEIAGKYYPFDDRLVVQEFLSKRGRAS
ncbi:MAG: UDP-N-acetylmuramoyl-L-alanyl-D-glutamate--2,6-diaminopimelate ligase [Candidatus Methylacidiphilales bacterium]|nr:UDP-N-acetylmuramoyl-L-alanyl-D-glutamate--2,6-diaminopimelate ligase [Candidatus Methylacidiphilales bacterium]